MMQQLTLTDDEPASPNFESDALGFLVGFARRNPGRAFSSEEVTLAALHAGVVPTDLRRWGNVFQQAARDRVIFRSPRVFSRSMGHGALTLGWVAL